MFGTMADNDIFFVHPEIGDFAFPLEFTHKSLNVRNHPFFIPWEKIGYLSKIKSMYEKFQSNYIHSIHNLISPRGFPIFHDNIKFIGYCVFYLLKLFETFQYMLPYG